MKKYLLPKTTSVNVNLQGMVCASSPSPAPGKVAVESITIDASDTWS